MVLFDERRNAPSNLPRSGANLNPTFWHERWESGQLGFHQDEVNPQLNEYWPRLGLNGESTVFVPLCGKSLDMKWIREQGHPVLGIELSPIAIKDFFESISIPEQKRQEEQHGALRRIRGGGYELYCGDFFELEAADLRAVRAVYDRASLIALPPDIRKRYARHMIEKLPAHVQILLITIEYDQDKMNGPPHSVPPAEVDALFGGAFEIETLFAAEPSQPTPRFQERGLDSWQENIQLLTRSEAPRA